MLFLSCIAGEILSLLFAALRVYFSYLNMDKIRLENLIFFYASACSEPVFSKNGKLICLRTRGFLPALLQIYNTHFSAENGHISREDFLWEKRTWRRFYAWYAKEYQTCPPAAGTKWKQTDRSGAIKNLSLNNERLK